MGLGVSEPQCRAPRPAEYQPTLDPEMLAQALHVLHQVPGRVVDQAGVGSALAAAALVKQDDAVALRIEEAPHLGIGPPTGAAVNKHGRLAARVTALFVVDLVDVRYA